MTKLSTLSDDHFINMILNTEMPLPTQRETVLNFFERVQKIYPTMRNFYTRDNGDFVLEEDKDQPQHRWLAIEPRRICSGCVNPSDPQVAFEQHQMILELVPYMLSVSPLDCEALDFLLGFDFNYRGNHDELVAEALGAGAVVDAMTDLPRAAILNYEPSMTIALDDSCRRQARLVVETRTNAYQVRRGEFNEDPISVYFTVRQYGSLPAEATYHETLDDLRETCFQLLDEQIVDQVLFPLSQAISTR